MRSASWILAALCGTLMLIGCSTLEVSMGNTGMKRTTLERDATGVETSRKASYPDIPQAPEKRLPSLDDQLRQAEYEREYNRGRPKEKQPREDHPAEISSVGSKRSNIFYFMPGDIDGDSLRKELQEDTGSNSILKNQTSISTAVTGVLFETEALVAFNDLLQTPTLHRQINPGEINSDPRMKNLLDRVEAAEKSGLSPKEDDLLALNRRLLQASFPTTTRHSHQIMISQFEEGKGERINEDLTHGLSFGLSGVRLWTELKTDFNSASISNSTWNSNPKLMGHGGSLRYQHRPIDSDFGLIVSGGLFQGDQQTNSAEQGGVFVKEKTEIKGGWLEIGGQYYPFDFLQLDISLGGFNYHARSSIETNAPTFVYHGFSGDRTIAAIGFGGGLETPWRYPVRMFLDSQFYLPYNPFNSDEQLLESVIGRVGGGLLYRF